jgi:hypothetical protein
MRCVLSTVLHAHNRRVLIGRPGVLAVKGNIGPLGTRVSPTDSSVLSKSVGSLGDRLRKLSTTPVIARYSSHNQPMRDPRENGEVDTLI